MEARSATVKPFLAKGKERRPYGKAPLELGLSEALETVGRIAQEGKSMSELRLAIILGNTVTSSAFTRKIRALTFFGLLDEQAGEQFTLTELALAIALPRSPQSQTEAKKQAFLNIEQFNLLFNQHKGKLLPADEFLRNILEQQSGVPRDFSQEWVKQFKDGARAVGLFYSRGDGKIQIAESPIPTEAQVPQDESNEKTEEVLPRPDVSDGNKRVFKEPPQTNAPPVREIAVSGHHTRIDLSDGRRAEIIIPDRLTARDAKKLQKALSGIAVIIDSMVSEDGA